MVELLKKVRNKGRLPTPVVFCVSIGPSPKSLRDPDTGYVILEPDLGSLVSKVSEGPGDAR